MNRDPIIGSCVNLISRAKIRYEGILYTIDSTAKTITLSKVRSHGTEDRPSARYAPPRSDVFEYIVFKGSDIEDIYTVDVQESGPGYNDPAILKAGASSIPAAPKLEQSQDAFSKPVQMLVDNLMQNSIWGTVGEVESPPSLQHPKPAMKDPRSAPKDLQGFYGLNAAEQPRRVYPPKVAHETQTSVVVPIVTDSSASASAQAKPKQRQPSPVEDKNNSSVPGKCFVELHPFLPTTSTSLTCLH